MRLNRYLLITLLVLIGLTTANAQVTLTLYKSNPAASSLEAFGGSVFQAGTEFGDATFYAKFGGIGTKYFEIDSPGESVTKKITTDSLVSIRPITSMVINQSKIKVFSGVVNDSVVVTVKPLSITTTSVSSTTDVSPGSEITVSYQTGAGTFPAGLVSKKFKVQLLDVNGNLLTDLLNSTDQYSGQERPGSSAGGIRFIKATIPSSTTSGSYRVRVITQGLIANVLGSSSNLFTVKAAVPLVSVISTINLTDTYCVGSTVSFPFSTTGTFPTGNTFKVQLVNTNGTTLQELSGTSATSPISATLPGSLTSNTYRFQIVATAASIQSNTSTVSVAALPTMTLSGSSTVATGSTAPVRLALTGTSPWSFTYTDNATMRATSSSVPSTTISPTFTASTVYDKSFIKGFSDKYCAVSSVISGSAQVTVISQLTITTSTVSGSLCPGSTIPVSFTASTALPSDVIYQAQLSDGAGSFSTAQSIGTGSSSPVSVTLPASLTAGTGYRIQIIVQKPTTPGAVDYSNLISSVPATLSINRPDAPKVTSLSICSGTATVPFSATGTNLKWYQTPTGGTASTATPGFTSQTATVSTYYVTQSDGAGCESVRQPVSISVIATPSAPSVSSFSLCQNTQGQFPAVPNALWYTSPTSGTASTQPPSLTSQNAGEQTAYVTQTVNGCESVRTMVKATIVPTPAAPTVVASTTLCQLSAASSLTATGLGLTWYGPSGKLPAVPTPSTSASGIQSYSVTQTVNTCESPKALVNIVITTAPVPPVAGSVRYCMGDSPVSLNAMGTNLKWYVTNTSPQSLSAAPTPSTSQSGITTFYVSQSDRAGCESARQPVSVTVVATPSAPGVNSLTLCQNQPGGFSTTLPNLIWYPAATGGGGSSQPPAVTTQNAGELTVYVSQTVNGCESPRATVKATVYAIPPAPTVQASGTLCQNASATPLTASGNALTWYGPLGKLAGAPTPATSTSGIQSYSVTQTVNTCESSTAVTTVTVIPAPASPTVSSVSYCASTTTTSLSVTDSNLRWYTQLSGGNFSTTPPVFSLATATTLTFYVTQTNGIGCESTRKPVSVSIIATPSAPSVTSITLCEGQSGQFTSSIPGALWYTTPTSTSGSAQPPLINTTAGEQTFYVTQTLNGCESLKASVKAVVNATPAAPTVQSSISLCQNTTASSLTATGLGVIWYGSAGKLAGAPTPATSASGVQSYSVTQTVSGCESPKAAIRVQVNPAPNPPGVNTAQYCVGVISTPLTASGSNLKWYENSSGSQSLAVAPTPSTSQSGILQYYVSQTVNGCESARQPLSVSVTAASPTPTVNSVTLCQGATGNFNSSIPNAMWYASLTATTGTNQPPVVNNQAAGEQTFYVTQNTNGCESLRAAVKATVYPIPAVPTIQGSVSLCQNASAGALTATGTGGLIWYNQLGVMLSGAPTPATSASGVQSFSVSQTVNGCESIRATISVVVLPAPVPPVANSIRLCVNDLTVKISPTALPGNTTQWYTGQSGGTPTPESPGYFTTEPKVYTFYVTQTNASGCESARQPISVSVVAPPSAPTVTASQTVCQLASVTALTASPNTGLIWQGPGISGSSETAPIPVTSQPGTFTYSVVQKVGTCTSSPTQLLFTVAQTPPAPRVQSPVIYCVGTTSVPLSASGTNVTWYTKPDRSGPASTQVIPSTSQSGVTPYYVTQQDANNCESPNSVVEVRVSTKATARLTGDGFINPGDSTAIRIHLTGDAPWKFTDWNGRTLTLTNPSDSLYVVWVTPKQAQTSYAITNLSSTCGAGDAGAAYVLRFNAPLATLPVIEPLSVKAYPNPTTGDLTVDWSSPTKQTVMLQIIDATGNAIRQVTRQSTPTQQTEVFQLGTQPTGLYFLRIKTPTNGVVTKPIVKQ